MASPVVAATNTSALTTAGTSHTVNLPASISAGDLLIVVFAYMAPGATVVTWSANGFTAISGFQTENGTTQGIDAAYRWATGAEGSTITVTTDDSTKSAHTAYRITGAENPSTQAPECGTGATGTGTSNADPPSVSPTGGSKDYLAIACLALEGENYSVVEPADYTNLLLSNTGITGVGGVNGQVSTAQRQLTAATVDPGVFTHANEDWVAQTLVIHPAAGASTQNLTGTLFTKAPTFFTGLVTSVRNLAGALFTKSPTFFTGTVTATRTLTGALFTKAPTFFTGTVTATRTLTGVLFTKAPTFPTGAVSLAAGPQTVNGVLFTKAPTFPQGAVTSTYALTGTLFVKAPTFFTGTVTSGTVTLTGILFTKAPTFPQGTVTAGAVSLTGVLFQKAPTFPTGTVTAGAYPLTGVLFQKAPTFFTGTIGQAGTLFGTLFVKAPTFFTGSLAQGAPSFWQPDPAGWTANPAAFVRVGRFGPSPWGAELSGQRFDKAPTFPVGTVS